MSEALTAPDVIELVIALFESSLPVPSGSLPIPVTRAVPNPRPARHVTVRQSPGAGRPRGNPTVERTMVIVEAWGDRHEWASDTARDAHALIHSARGVVLGATQIYGVDDVSAPGDLPDPLSGQPRVTFTVQLTVRIR